VIFICRDLRDSAKIDWELLKVVASHPKMILTIVGDMSPLVIPKALNYPATSDRKLLLGLLRQQDVLLFTSQVDYHPLTIAESLVAGVPVVAKHSLGAREFGESMGVRTYDSREQAIQKLLDSKDVCETEQRYFEPKRMAREYLSIYKDLAL
jgi:putative colanic acid biosynthesis glycosyltransferase